MKRLADMDVSRFLFWLFLVALLIRVLAVLALRHISQPPGFQTGADGIDYGGSTFYGANNDMVLRTPKYMGGWQLCFGAPPRFRDANSALLMVYALPSDLC